MLIAVVGTDGAGKSTVTRLVSQALERDGRSVTHIDRWHIVDNPLYPAARFMRPDVPDTRLCVAEMPNPTRFLFLVWSIGLALLGRKTPSDGAGTGIEMLDGYWMKHAASEIVYGVDGDWAEQVVSALPVPDVVVYLRIEPEAAWDRKDGDIVPYECGMDESCSRDRFLAHQDAIQLLLDGWAARQGWIVVDAARSLPEVVADVRQAILASAGQRDPGVQPR
jgi:thymidylate kinase